MPWSEALEKKVAGAGARGVVSILNSRLHPCRPLRKDLERALEDPPEYPLANVWRRMKVGEIVYLYLLQGRAKLQAYMTYNLDSTTDLARRKPDQGGSLE